MSDLEKSHEELIQELEQLRLKTRLQEESLAEFKKNFSFYEDLIEHAADAIFMGDPQGNIIGTNRSAAILCGYSQTELLGMSLGRLFSAEQQQRTPLRYDLLKQGKTITTERLLTRKDGSTVPIEMNSRMMPDGTYHSFMRDLTGRRQMEEALRLSEEKFSRAFMLHPDAVALSRMADGSYIEINQGFTDIIGWQRAEVIGRKSNHEGINVWCNNADREQFIDGLRQHGEVKEFEFPFRHKNGGYVTCLISGRVIRINNEDCILSIVHDITERKILQEQQRQLELQMQQVQKLESLGVLAGGIAHDFNNILMAVLGHCELALRRLPEPSPALENLQQIKLAANKAADLANQMLAYSGKGRFVTEPLQLSALVAEMAQMLAVSVSKKALLRYKLAAQLPTTIADATQIRQVIMNLVINASEALGDRQGTITMATGAMACDQDYLRGTCLPQELPAGNYVYLEIADTGGGIDAETAARIFEPFYTTKFSGRGLGMAAVLGIVRGHKGAIKLDTALGKGTSFRILLPASDKAVKPAQREKLAPALKNSGLVLLVDDEEIVRRTGREMLEELGFDVVTAKDGRKAVAIFSAQHQQISFVLMDMTMPEMDGEEAFHELKRIAPTVKVIICSGYNEQEITPRFAQRELAGFLKKPFQLAELQKVIRDAT